MEIREQSSQFSILIFSNNIDQGAALKVAVSRAGYDVYFIDNEKAFIDRTEQMIPHVIVLSIKSLSSKLSETVDKLLSFSHEIKFIFLVEDENFQALSEYAEFGVLDILDEKSSQLENHVLWSVDRVCERIYLSYQNEQLLQELEALKKNNSLITKDVFTGSDVISDLETFTYKEFIANLKKAQSKEELIATMLGSNPEFQLLYLSYMPSMSSFLVTDTSYPAKDKLKGLGCRLESNENHNLAEQLRLGIVPSTLSKFLLEAFRIEKPRLCSLLNGNLLEGILVCEIGSEEKLKKINERFAIMSLVHANFCLEKRIENVEVMDSASELYNKNFYTNKLKEEVQRSRRFLHAVSVIKVGLDDLAEIEKTLGVPTRDLVFKNLAGIIQKSSRSHDFVCRTNLNEISIILPQSNKAETELRAERLRRIIETNSLIDSGLKMTISLGVAEYPSSSSSAEKLDEGAFRALQFIMSKGGNKLCFYKAPPDHKPDFVLPVTAKPSGGPA